MNERLDRKSWLKAGLAALADGGPAALKISAIATRIGVTKGSFYWHFRDLGNFEDELLVFWEERHTEEVKRRLEAFGGGAAERLRRLLTLAFETDMRLDNAVRQWSANDARAGRAQRRVDRDRLTYVAGLLSELGWNAPEAAALARWAYWAVVGLHAPQTPKPKVGETEIVLRTLIPS